MLIPAGARVLWAALGWPWEAVWEALGRASWNHSSTHLSVLGGPGVVLGVVWEALGMVREALEAVWEALGVVWEAAWRLSGRGFLK